MSSGLEWTEDQTEYSIEKADNWVQAILDLPVTSTPGTQFNYSTGNAHLIAAILTRAAGQPLPAFATAALFDPLGLHFEHWGKDPQGIASGGYNFYVTPRTLARFALMVFGGGQLGGKQLVPASWIASSLKPEEPAHTGYHYGYCYWLPRIAGHAVAKMWGYGGQFAYLIPDANLIVVITNDTAHSYPEPDGDAFVAKYILPAILK
jgi:CubicO group peptidase (beta-lactamase class C family)